MAFAYNGSSSYTNLGTLSVFNSSAVYTLSMRFKFNHSSNEQKLMVVGGFGSIPYSYFNLTVMPTDVLRWEAGDPFIYTYSSSTLATDTWHYVNAVWNGSTINIMVNGSSIGSRSVSNTGWDNSTTNLGRNGTNSEYYLSGAIAELGIWSVALTDDELHSLWVGYQPDMVRPQSLFEYYPLIRNATSIKGNPVTNTDVTFARHPRVYG